MSLTQCEHDEAGRFFFEYSVLVFSTSQSAWNSVIWGILGNRGVELHPHCLLLMGSDFLPHALKVIIQQYLFHM